MIAKGPKIAAPAPALPPPVPMIDDAAARRMARDRVSKRGRGTTILTSDNGLPDLGKTVTPMAGG